MDAQSAGGQNTNNTIAVKKAVLQRVSAALTPQQDSNLIRKVYKNTPGVNVMTNDKLKNLANKNTNEAKRQELNALRIQHAVGVNSVGSPMSIEDVVNLVRRYDAARKAVQEAVQQQKWDEGRKRQYKRYVQLRRTHPLFQKDAFIPLTGHEPNASQPNAFPPYVDPAFQKSWMNLRFDAKNQQQIEKAKASTLLSLLGKPPTANQNKRAKQEAMLKRMLERVKIVKNARKRVNENPKDISNANINTLLKYRLPPQLANMNLSKVSKVSNLAKLFQQPPPVPETSNHLTQETLAQTEAWRMVDKALGKNKIQNLKKKFGLNQSDNRVNRVNRNAKRFDLNAEKIKLVTNGECTTIDGVVKLIKKFRAAQATSLKWNMHVKYPLFKHEREKATIEAYTKLLDKVGKFPQNRSEWTSNQWKIAQQYRDIWHNHDYIQKRFKNLQRLKHTPNSGRVVPSWVTNHPSEGKNLEKKWQNFGLTEAQVKEKVKQENPQGNKNYTQFQAIRDLADNRRVPEFFQGSGKEKYAKAWRALDMTQSYEQLYKNVFGERRTFFGLLPWHKNVMARIGAGTYTMEHFVLDLMHAKAKLYVELTQKIDDGVKLTPLEWEEMHKEMAHVRLSPNVIELMRLENQMKSKAATANEKTRYETLKKEYVEYTGATGTTRANLAPLKNLSNNNNNNQKTPSYDDVLRNILLRSSLSPLSPHPPHPPHPPQPPQPPQRLPLTRPSPFLQNARLTKRTNLLPGMPFGPAAGIGIEHSAMNTYTNDPVEHMVPVQGDHDDILADAPAAHAKAAAPAALLAPQVQAHQGQLAYAQAHTQAHQFPHVPYIQRVGALPASVNRLTNRITNAGNNTIPKRAASFPKGSLARLMATRHEVCLRVRRALFPKRVGNGVANSILINADAVQAHITYGTLVVGGRRLSLTPVGVKGRTWLTRIQGGDGNVGMYVRRVPYANEDELLRQAKLSSLGIPFLPFTYGAGHWKTKYFVVLTEAFSMNMGTWIRQGCQTSSAISGLLQMLIALAAMHGQGIVHRRVKASNVMCTKHTRAGEWWHFNLGTTRVMVKQGNTLFVLNNMGDSTDVNANNADEPQGPPCDVMDLLRLFAPCVVPEKRKILKGLYDLVKAEGMDAPTLLMSPEGKKLIRRLSPSMVQIGVTVPNAYSNTQVQNVIPTSYKPFKGTANCPRRSPLAPLHKFRANVMAVRSRVRRAVGLNNM